MQHEAEALDFICLALKKILGDKIGEPPVKVTENWLSDILALEHGQQESEEKDVIDDKLFDTFDGIVLG